MRVIADHIRTIAFSIADGQLPSNAKAGYVIRRILRRAVRYGYTFLEQRKSFIHLLLPALIDTMGDAYPELPARKDLMEKIIREEEDAFLRTLETGIRLLDKIMDDARADSLQTVDGADAFVLYDTYGFPLDLTELILREQRLEVDRATFNAEMKKQKERARNAAATETGDWVSIRDGEPEFAGYDFLTCETEILRYRKVTQKNQEYYQIVLSRTPFYAEMGGQTGDRGRLTGVASGETLDIFDTKRENNLAVHLSRQLPADVNSVFRAEVDPQKRTASECNHTATHLLHEALRKVLGTHVEQKGSYVSPELLRFDFSHFQKLTDSEIRDVERLVTSKIRENIALDERRHVPLAEAKALGAMALFGEKYGDDVRVVRFGSSVELCGGTHISATGRIGTFRITAESSIAAGVRRIEAVTAEVCENLLYAQQDLVGEIAAIFHNTSNLAQTAHKFMEENAELKKQVDEYLKEKAVSLKKTLVERQTQVGDIRLFVVQGLYSPDMVKDVAFRLRGEFPEKMCLAGATVNDGKPSLTLMFSDDLVARGLNAAQIVREAAHSILGGGGGQAHFATAGGKDLAGLNKALDVMLEKIRFN
jgi:alanyl-tRNA synthetase